MYGRGFSQDDQDYWDYWQPNTYRGNDVNQNNITLLREYKDTQNAMIRQKGMGILKDRSVYTPDIINLKLSGTLFPMFFYGEEQLGKVFSVLTEDCEYYGKAQTCTNIFVLQKCHQELCSGILFETGRELVDSLGIYSGAGKKVSGELYGVPLSVLCKMDKRYRNGWKFKRKEFLIEVQDPYNDSCKYQRSWTYIGIPEKFESIKMSTASVRYKNGVDGTYYYN